MTLRMMLDNYMLSINIEAIFCVILLCLFSNVLVLNKWLKLYTFFVVKINSKWVPFCMEIDFRFVILDVYPHSLPILFQIQNKDRFVFKFEIVFLFFLWKRQGNKETNEKSLILSASSHWLMCDEKLVHFSLRVEVMPTQWLRILFILRRKRSIPFR